MTTVRIEHPVRDFGLWKEAFDSDPIGRERLGVRRYRVMRAIDDPNYVMIGLDFDNPSDAEGLIEAMRPVWDRVAGTLVFNPQARIVEPVETKEY